MENTTFCKVAFTFGLGALVLARAGHLSAQPTVTVLDSIVLEESGDDPIDPSRSRACPDGLIALEDGSHPAIGFEGDLLLVLDQVIRGGDAETVVRRIQVETDDCDWVPLSR